MSLALSTNISYTRAICTTIPPMQDHLDVGVGFWAPRILQIPLKESKGKEFTKSPPVWPSEPGLWGAKISGDPVQSMCSQSFRAVALLASILRSWHRGSWN